MKRIFAALLATIMILSIVPVSPVIALDAPTFSVSDGKGSAGEQVTLSVNIASNPGVIAVGLHIGYNSAILELKSAAIKDFADTSFGPTSGNPFNISWDDVLNPNNTANGTLAELTFHIKEGTALGEYPVTVSYDEDNVFNSDFDNVYFATQNGKITVVEKSVAVTGVTIDETISVNIGEKKTPTYTVQPGNASNKAVSFVSGDPSIASVNETTGEITGVTKGTTTVTVTTADGGFSDTCAVTVVCPHTTKTQVIEKASTCTEQGWDAYSKCDTCNQLFNAEGDEIDAIPYRALLTHTNGDPVRENEIASSCEKAGSYDEVVYCTVCHTEISRASKTIPALGHIGGTATCHSKAICTRCGLGYGVLDPNNHDGETEIRDAYDPTCTEIGYTGDTYCLGCGTKIATGESIPALGHSFTNYISNNDATCTVDGTKTAKCDHCDATDTIADIGSKLGHDYKAVVTDPTCTAQGYTTHTCTHCKNRYVDSYTNALGHTGGTATCHSKAICTRCHKEYGEVDPANHDGETEVRGAVAATCTAAGYTGDTYCLGCGAKIAVGEDIAAFGHAGGMATCHSKAICTRCGLEYGVLDLNNHDGETEIRNAKAATCIETGYTGDTYCLGCGAKIARGEVSAKRGHSFTNYISDGNATCTADGTKTAKCDRCDATDTVADTDSKLGHNYVSIVTDATCTEQGYTTHTCSRCQDSYVDDYTNALGHTGGTATCHSKAVCERCHTEYGEYDPANHDGETEIRDAKAATCTEAGYTGDTYCLGCGTKIKSGEIIPLFGHNYNAVVTNPTCTAQGYTTHTCSRCGNSYVDNYTAALGHTVTEWEYGDSTHWHICTACGEKLDEAEHTASDWIIDREASMQITGEKHKECTVCGKTLETEIIPKLYTPGDINGDGEVNNKDLTRLFQYLSDWDVTINEAALDVNGDGKVNNKDLTRLFQYLSDWDVVIF